MIVLSPDRPHRPPRCPVCGHEPAQLLLTDGDRNSALNEDPAYQRLFASFYTGTCTACGSTLSAISVLCLSETIDGFSFTGEETWEHASDARHTATTPQLEAPWMAEFGRAADHPEVLDPTMIAAHRNALLAHHFFGPLSLHETTGDRLPGLDEATRLMAVLGPMLLRCWP